MASVLSLDPARYQRHLIHTQERAWGETNCYVDVLIELLHAWGYEPLAAMPFTIGIDFEGDQWTFFKFAHSDLRELYGLDLQELAIWQPLVRHVEEQLRRGNPVLVELDSCYLPDTVGSAYRLQHQKSTVGAVAIDIAARTLGYFHGQGYYELHGEDFTRVFRLEENDPACLPPYVEFIKRHPEEILTQQELVATSLNLLKGYVRRLPRENPFVSFKTRFATDLAWLLEQPMEMFHQYSFATLRQFGACYELAATYLKWLQSHEVVSLADTIEGMLFLSTSAKTLQFHLARAVARKKPLDLSVIDDLAERWDLTTTGLKSRLLNS